MRTIQFNIPSNIEISDYDFSMTLATKLYEDAKLSAGQAAQIVGLSKRAFIEVLGKFGGSLFSTELIDLQNDIKNA